MDNLQKQDWQNINFMHQHHATSTNVAWKIWPFSNLSQQHPTCRNTSQQGDQTHATCCTQQCCDTLRWNVAIVRNWSNFSQQHPICRTHVATGWPNARNMLRPTMLRYVVLACCDRFAGALHFNATYRTIVACVWPPCCDVLRYVECCWLKLENDQIFYAAFVDVARWCCRLARFMQQFCAWACALVWFSNRNMSTRYYNRVAKRARHVAPNNVVICCVQMLRSLGRNLQMLGQQCWNLLRWEVVIVWSGLSWKHNDTCMRCS